MKRVGLVLLVFLILGGFVSAQAPPDLPLDDEVFNNTEAFRERADRLGEFTEEERWNYLGEEWKENFLKNDAVSKFDEGMRKINFLLFFLFGQDYDFSMIWLLAVLLWAVFFSTFFDSIVVFSPFSKLTAFMSSFILTIIAGHLGVFRVISDKLFAFVFYRHGIWGWIILGVSLLIVVFYLIFSYKLFKRIKLHFKLKEREKKFQQMEKTAERGMQLFDTINEGIAEPEPSAFSEINQAMSDLWSAVTFEEARSKYRRYSMKFHPDRGGSDKDMTNLNLSWEKLKKSRGW